LLVEIKFVDISATVDRAAAEQQIGQHPGRQPDQKQQ